MEIKFKQGDSVIIPEGCKAVIHDGVVVFENESHEFKDGDIVYAKKKNTYSCPFIFKGRDKDGFNLFYVGIAPGGCLIQSTRDARWSKEILVPATQEEKQRLFDKMKEQGLRWNAEEKKVEEIKWQPQNGERYFFVNALCEIGSIAYLENYIDELLEKTYNQFRTEEQAKKAADAVRETLRRFHEGNKQEMSKER